MNRWALLCLLLWGQSPLLVMAQGDTAVLQRYLSQAGVSKDQNKPEEAGAFYEKALGLLRGKGDKKGMAAVLAEYAEVRMVQAKLPEAEEMLNESIRLSKELGNDRLQWPYGLLGAVQIQMGKPVEALTNELLAIRLGEQYTDTSAHMAEIYNYAAIIYSKMGKLAESGEYVRKAIATGSHAQDPMLAVQFRANLANILIQQHKPREALEDLLLLQRNYGRIMPLNARIQTLSRFVRCYSELGDSSGAGRSAKELIRYSDSLKPDEYDQLAILTQLNRYLLWSGQYEKARRFVARQQLTGEKFKIPEQRMQAFLYRATIDSAAGHMASALHFYQLYARVRDSTGNVAVANQLNQLHVAYETEKKDKELLVKQQHIELLQKSNRLQEMELERAAFIRDATIAGALGLALMSFLLYSRYRMKKRSSEELAVQREEIRKKNVALEALIGDKDKLLAEKEWLMKEVHHRVKNNLQMVISLLNSQSAYLSSEDAVAAIKESQRRMHAMSLIHQRLYEKDEATIDMGTYITDLVAYLKDSFECKGVQFALDLDPLTLDVSRAVPIGLILNEAITNSLKYAFPGGQAGYILVSLKATPLAVELTVADDGIGLPEGKTEDSKKSLGMSLLQGLTTQIGGTYAISGEKGVEIIIRFSPVINESL
jgi:two-component sensor histidine kinase